MDLLLAVVLILSALPIGLGKHPKEGHDEIGCKLLGVANQFVFMAGLLWYGVMTLNLRLAIRNPFRCGGTESVWCAREA